MSKTTLFAVPYAGGSAAATYNRWANVLGDDIDVVPLEYKGHGRRMDEPFADSVEETVEDFLETILPMLSDEPYAFYGHSMGCVIVYELVKAIHERDLPAPVSVFLSGRKPAHQKYFPDIHMLSDDGFLQEIRDVGGTPQAFFDDKILVKTFLPILRNDYRIIELYDAVTPIHTSTADLTIFLSDNDSMVDENTAQDWKDYTSGKFKIHRYRGDHFFIQEQYKDICQKIKSELSRIEAPLISV